MLNNQKTLQNRKRLGFGKKKKNKKSNKKSHGSKGKNDFGNINYFYYNQRGHRINNCHYRNSPYILKSNKKLGWLLKAFTFKSYLIQFIIPGGLKNF